MEMQLKPRIVANPDVLSGEAIVAGTTVSVSAVLRDLAGARETAKAATRLGLSEDDIRAALEYAAEVIAESIYDRHPILRLAGISDEDLSEWARRHDEVIAEEAMDPHDDKQ